MARRCLPFLLVCLCLAACDKHARKAPDPTKGAVTGIVLCADTGKPARFAIVALTAAPRSDEKGDPGDPLPAAEITATDLDGRFRLEAVPPGHYYAFATLEGYLDPRNGLDPDRIRSLSTGAEQRTYSIEQWKNQLTEVTVAVHRVSEVSIQIERAAEISGTVTYDDGSPAIGMHFLLTRKTENNGWANVGLPLLDSWSMHAVSDGHGHYSLTNLTAGEYAVCTLMPADSEEEAPTFCLGGTFRKKDAATVKIKAGEIATGTDIEIPLSGLHTVAGTVTAIADGHAVGRGRVRLLYADNRDPARETSLIDDGSFSFEYVPEGSYILQVSQASDAEPENSGAGEGDNTTPPPKTSTPRHYTDKEIPLAVAGEVNDANLTLATAQPDKPAPQ